MFSYDVYYYNNILANQNQKYNDNKRYSTLLVDLIVNTRRSLNKKV